MDHGRTAGAVLASAPSGRNNTRAPMRNAAPLSDQLQRLEATMRGELADIRAEMDEFVSSLLKAQAQAQARVHRQLGDVDTEDLQRQVSCPPHARRLTVFLPLN